MADVFPHPHRHRFCIRHIIVNLKKWYNVKDLDKVVWRCVSAQTMDKYDVAIQVLEEACPEAKAELTGEINPDSTGSSHAGSSRSPHVTPPEDVEHVTRISWKGQAGEDWATYHRGYVARWQARAKTVVTGSHAHTPRHAPSEYMTWYLSVTRRFVSSPPTEPTMVYHARGYTEETLTMDPSLADPYMMEIGHYCQSILHSLPLLEGTIVGGEMSRGSEHSHVVKPTRDRA
ncbi:hypothetical protein H6P81_010553 [Aristolochia fimbriata]|uniref:Transposase n=1 Tax=Aristolochia fimbriata TaxID=158543 RepID=A0AAV7ETJ2_ARIFI|nr:hypothetical protein H6P81_010553 [Aristolochia fimbriata]